MHDDSAYKLGLLNIPVLCGLVDVISFATSCFKLLKDDSMTMSYAPDAAASWCVNAETTAGPGGP